MKVENNFLKINVWGWIIFGCVDTYIQVYRHTVTIGNITGPIENIAGHLITLVTGFTTSLLLRRFLRNIDITNQISVPIILKVVLYTLVGILIWFTMDSLLSIPLWGIPLLKKYFGSFSTIRFFAVIYYHVTVLILWTALYFGIKFWIRWKFQQKQTESAVLISVWRSAAANSFRRLTASICMRSSSL